MRPPEPTAPSFALEADGTVWVEWPDGHQSRLSMSALRAACPCATCRDARDRRDALKVISPLDPRSFVLLSIEAVGNYAVTLVWQDGHRTGIYPYRLLRALCDCLGCRLDRENGSA